MHPAQEHSAEQAAPARKRVFGLNGVLPLVSLGLSLFSLFTSEEAKNDVARLDTIKTEYGLFHELAQMELQNPIMLHLFTITNRTYDMAAVQVRMVRTGMTEPERAKALLQERAVAHAIFTSFEETFELWRHTSDKQRAAMALGSLEYFVGHIQNNPRMLWYWDEKGGNLQASFDAEFQDYYSKNILNGGQADQDQSAPLGNPGGR